MSKKEYFAYGSNLNFEQMAYRCPEATAVGTAKLDGYELAFRRGYLTVLPKEGASVEGLIWSITDHDESQLDCYEGYPTFYDKETMTVTDADGTPHKKVGERSVRHYFLPQIKITGHGPCHRRAVQPTLFTAFSCGLVSLWEYW